MPSGTETVDKSVSRSVIGDIEGGVVRPSLAKTYIPMIPAEDLIIVRTLVLTNAAGDGGMNY